MSEWISVNDETFPHEVDLLVFCRKGSSVGITTSGYFDGQWMSFETEESTWGEVTHWMHLPDWPK